jgi:hypothetical protein
MKALTVLTLLSSVSWAKHSVKTGLDVLVEKNYTQLAGRKVIVLTNPTGVTPDLDLGVDVMFKSGAVDIVGVMGPEHGFRGTAQAGGSEGTFIDPETGLTVYVRCFTPNLVFKYNFNDLFCSRMRTMSTRPHLLAISRSLERTPCYLIYKMWELGSIHVSPPQRKSKVSQQLTMYRYLGHV